MSRQDANAAFALSSFLQGTNAPYIDDIYARYEKDPNSVDAEWQEFFKSLKDQPADVLKNAEGPSWGRDNWPLTPRDDLTSALDGNWAQVEKAVGAKLACLHAASLLAPGPERMRLVDDERGAHLAFHARNLPQRSAIPEHAEDALGHDDAAAREAFEPAEPVGKILRVIVTKTNDLCGAELARIIDRGVTVRVDEQMVFASRES